MPGWPMSEIKVVNIHHEEPYDVYIGRCFQSRTIEEIEDLRPYQTGYFGNPYSHLGGVPPEQQVATREEAVRMYERYAWGRIDRDERFRRTVKSLKGKSLGCFCSPLPCHGDILKLICEVIWELDSYPNWDDWDYGDD